MGLVYQSDTYEALPGVKRGKRAFISGEQRKRANFLGEQRQYSGTGNIRKQIFDLWKKREHANLFQRNRETGTQPPPRESFAYH